MRVGSSFVARQTFALSLLSKSGVSKNTAKSFLLCLCDSPGVKLPHGRNDPRPVILLIEWKVINLFFRRLINVALDHWVSLVQGELFLNLNLLRPPVRCCRNLAGSKVLRGLEASAQFMEAADPAN
jgi:hypothetical protein